MSTTIPSEQDPANDLTARIVEAVTSREDVGPLEVPPLYETIDPDALAGVFSPPDDNVDHVTFTYYGYEITVEGPGDVHVTPLEEC